MLSSFWATVWVVIKWILCILGIVCIFLFFKFRNERLESTAINNRISGSFLGQLASGVLGEEIVDRSDETREPEILFAIGGLLGLVGIVFWLVIPFWSVIKWVLALIPAICFLVFRGNSTFLARLCAGLAVVVVLL